MVHNGIEYGLMEAYAEGYELLETKDIVKDVPGAFKAWSRGTVVRSWLLDLLVKALEENPTLDGVSDYTVDSGEGRWTVEEAIALSVPMPVISRVAVRPVRLPPGRLPDDEGRRRAARPVRRPRGHDDRRGRGAAPRGPPPARPGRRSRPPRPRARDGRRSRAASGEGPQGRSAGPSSGAGATS